MKKRVKPKTKKKTTRRKPRGRGKGPRYERDVCRALSNWWAAGRDDIFWRTHGSGARATSRAKSGKRTAGQYGDVCASDPAGAPLIAAITWSLKRGYADATLQDLVDYGGRGPWAAWIAEAEKTALSADTPFWAVVSKRNNREAVMVIPRTLARRLYIVSEPWVFQFRDICVLTFAKFLEEISPREVRDAAAVVRS